MRLDIWKVVYKVNGLTVTSNTCLRNEGQEEEVIRVSKDFFKRAHRAKE